MSRPEHHRSTSDPSSRHRGATSTRLIAPLAVVALLAVTAWLEFDSRSAERSRRAAAEDAVREHARAAAAQYTRRIATLLQSRMAATVAPVRDMRLREGEPLLGPRFLTDHAWRCVCGAMEDVLFTFRFDFDDGRLIPDRDLVAPVLRSLTKHVPQALPQITENANAASNGSDPTHSDLRQTAMIVFDTVASQPFVITYALVADATNRPRALYGVASDPKHLRAEYERLVPGDSVLPPTVAKGRPNDSLLVVRITDATTGTILERPTPLPTGAVIHADTLEKWLGGQIVTVAIRPELVSELLIGDPVTPPRPLQLTLLVVAAVLSLVALAFRGRGRRLR